MIEDINKVIELFYIVFLFIYNKWGIFTGIDMESISSIASSESVIDDSDSLSDITTETFEDNDDILNQIVFTGSQQTYFTRVSKSKKAICDYPDDMTILTCHMLTNETDVEKQTILSQLFKGVDSSVEEQEIIVDLNDDIDARITVSQAVKDKTKKNAVVRDIKLSVESYFCSKEEILKRISEIKKLYVKVNGQVKPKFINEMYIYYFDEPCLLEHQQVMKIKKTVKDVVQYYGTSNNNADRFLKSLLT
jgi:hypothetical protein